MNDTADQCDYPLHPTSARDEHIAEYVLSLHQTVTICRKLLGHDSK